MPRDCPGCFFQFSAAGLAIHLSQTTNLACIDAAAELNDLFDVLSSDDDLDHRDDLVDNSHGLDSPPSPPQFTGDYFGSYNEDDLEWPILDSDVPLPEDEEGLSDTDTEPEDDLMEAGWEPNPAPGVFEDCDAPMEYEIPPSSPGQDHSSRQGIEDPLWNDPTIETFPIATAGKVYSHEGENSYQRSQQQFTGPGPHQPFASKMDWEIARWAKLRGPSSTAFTELLKIEGVCGLYFLPPHCRLMRFTY